MTLKFNSEFIPSNPNEDVFCCVQTSQEPKEFVNATFKKTHCRNCKSVLFPLNDDTKLECPICNPDADFSSKIFKLSQPAPERNIIIFAFDITIPHQTILFLLNDLYNNMKDNEKLSIVCITDKTIFVNVNNNLLEFDTYASPTEIQFPMQSYITKEQLREIVIPSISTVYALFPDELPDVCNYCNSIKAIIKISHKIPFTIYLFAQRPADRVSIESAQIISQAICDNQSILHIGAVSDFKRHIAIARLAFGSVFGIHALAGSIFAKLRENSQVISKFRIFAPRSVEFSKVTGSAGNLKMSSKLSKLKLSNFIGGSVSFHIEEKRNKIRLLETSRTESGTFLALHTFQKTESFRDTIDVDLTNSIIMKFFASDVIRATMRGENFDKVLKQHLRSVEAVLGGTSLSKIGSDEQNDLLKLYYVLQSYGPADIKVRGMKIGSSVALLVPPTLFVYETAGMDISKVQADASWPLELRVLKSESEFEQICQNYGVDPKTI